MDDKRHEFGAVAIVLALLGALFVVMLLADVGLWGWVVLGLAAAVGIAVLFLVLARRPTHPSDLDAPVTRARSSDDGKHRVLVVSDGSATSEAFHHAVASRAAGRPLEVLVVAPALESRLSRWTGDDQARHQAEGNLERTVAALVADGVAARGDVGSDDPIQAADDALREFPADEIVLATHADQEANWEERGVVEIARSRYDLPVTQVTVDAG